MVFTIQTGLNLKYFSSTHHTDVPVKKGTELGRFQVCKTVEIINNQEHMCHENKQTAQVFTVQEFLQGEKGIKQHLAPTTRPDLEKELVNLLLLHIKVLSLSRITVLSYPKFFLNFFT